jgi:alpha-galactosidase
LTQLDPNNYHRITTSLLTHNEVLDINQDPLGKAGKRVEWTPESEVWSRPLSDGTVAVGLFNRGERPQAVNIEWSRLGLNGPQPVRDVWRRSNLGNLNNGYSAIVPRHGAVLIKVGKPQSPTS